MNLKDFWWLLTISEILISSLSAITSIGWQYEKYIENGNASRIYWQKDR